MALRNTMRLALLALAVVGASAAGVAASKVDAAHLPASFDARDAFYGCADLVLNQAECGSCWAVSAASTLSDRFCVHRSSQFAAAGPSPAALSPQPLLSCATAAAATAGDRDDSASYESEGCNGGFQDEAWRFLQAHGVAAMSADQTGGCRPYWSSKCSPDPAGDGCLPCAAVAQCIDSGEAPVRYSAVGVGAVTAASLPAQVAAVQAELAANGPVQACFDVAANFFDFFSASPAGVYNSSEDTPNVGGHCVKIIGWGTTEREHMPFWLIANSWGTDWAQRGVFRYLRGADLGGMDTAVWAGCPAGTPCSLTPAVQPPPVAPPFPRASGGRWRAQYAPHAGASHLRAAMAAVARHLEAEQIEEHAPLLAALRPGADVDAEGTVVCAHTQVVAGLRTRLVLRGAAPGDGPRSHVIATTLLRARDAMKRGRDAGQHAVESLIAVDAAEAGAACFAAAERATADEIAAAKPAVEKPAPLL